METESTATFLLVEDDDDHAELIQQNIEKIAENVMLRRVSTGDDAIRFLRRIGAYKGFERPDLVILDLSLPDVDGHEILAEIKRDAELHTLPVVVLTSSERLDDRLRAYERRTNSFVVKPTSPQGFQQLVSDLTRFWANWNRTAS